AEHLARRIVVRASPSVPCSEVRFRTARCRPLRQPRWLALQPQPGAKHICRPCPCSLTFLNAPESHAKFPMMDDKPTPEPVVGRGPIAQFCLASIAVFVFSSGCATRVG